jgi:hypothetical protein
MRFSFVRPLSWIASACCGCGSLFSQTLIPGPAKIEPGLELAVSWKWWVVPSEKKEWGLPLPEALLPKPSGGSAPQVPALRPETYEVKKGDALIKIAKKFDMSVAQLKQFNDLKDDRIRIGQIVRIPTLGQLLTMLPPPPPPQKAAEKSAELPTVVPDLSGEKLLELENVRQQVFLDREMFSPGPIDGKSGATFLKIREIYQRAHPEAADPSLLKMKAEAIVKEPYTRYILRADDFKFIKPPKNEPQVARSKEPSLSRKKSANPDKAAPAAPVTIDEQLAADFLGYTSGWEFVAERFHCDEAFLHQINPALKGVAVVGSEFQVPNVIPFEIEKALDAPLQPVADPQQPVTAAVILVSWLEISRGGNLIAVMPLTAARPGLHGRGSWTVREAIPQPRLATKREPREPPKELPAATSDGISSAKPVIEPAQEKAQYLAAGPNNPVGILWLNLSKSGSTEPLPYGLHGTSIPSKMRLPGIGGLRLSNWDIARATRLMPVGTALQWRAK